jgi:hypothetical protein
MAAITGIASVLLRAAFDVAVKADFPSPLPIRRIISVDPHPRTHSTKEDVLRWIDNNAYMPSPNN